jgi:PAS domain S-box-containing protein
LVRQISDLILSMKRWRISFALQISLLYALLGGLWILLSDRTAAVLFPNPAYFAMAQTYKGWFFILVTAILLFILVAHESRTRKKAEQRYGELFESAVEGIFRSRPDGRFISVNPAMAQIFGYSTPEEMLNKVNDISSQLHLNGESHQKFTRLLHENDVVEKFETQNLRKDGSVIWTSTNARVVRDENGKVLHYEGFITDITTRKTAEHNLRETEARYRAVVEHMPAAVYTDAPNGISPNYFSSPQIFGITGYSAKDWEDDPELWAKILHPEDRQRVLAESDRTNTTHDPFDIEYRIISREGKAVWIHDRATLICDERGHPLYWQGLLFDITTQKLAEVAIRASEARYHALVEDAADAIFISDAQGKYFEVNQRACDMLGYSRSQLLNLNIKDLLTPEELAVRPLKLYELSSGRTVVTERLFIRKDGNMVPVELSTKMLPDGMVMSIARDITERRLIQDTLARSEQRFRALIEHSMDAIALISPEGKILYQSPASLDILGYTLSEMLGCSVFDFIHHEDHQRVDGQFQEIMKSPGNHSTAEFRCIHKNGSVKWLEFINTNRVNEPGVNAIVSNYRDITAHKAAEESLRSAESKYRALVENMSPVVYADAVEDLVTFYISPQIHVLLGYSSEEWLADERSWSKCVHPEDRERIKQKLEHCKKTGETFLSDYRMIARDGRVVWVRDQSSLVRGEGGNPIYWQGVFLNISEQKQAEAELREAELRYRVLVERLPAVVFMDLFNEAQDSHYMSPRLFDLVGYTPDEWMNGDNLWENSLHPDDRERVLAEDLRTDQTGEPFKIEYRLRARDGNYVWVREEAYMIRGEDGIPQYWQGILLNITEQKQAQESLRRREVILEAVGFAAEQFLKSSNWEDCLPKVLKRLGETSQASRVYVFKKHFAPDDSLLISQLYEWCDDDIEPQMENPALQNTEFAQAGYSRWIRLFNEGVPVYGIVRELPPDEQAEFTREGILSIICFPIQIGNDWWGFIGFDDCRTEREWSALEIEALRAAVSTLGAAIQRKMTEEAVFSGETSYQDLFNSVSDAIHIHNTDGRLLDVNDGAVQMYGYPKSFFMGQTPDALSAADRNDMGAVSRAFRIALQGEPQHFEFWGLRSNGEIFPEEIHLYKGVYFGRDVVISIAQDITERKRAEEALQRRLKELTVLHAIAVAESSAETSDELIQRVTDIIGDSLYTDNCGILLLDSSGTLLVPHYSYHGAGSEVLSAKLPVSEGISGKVVTTRAAFRTGDVSKETVYFQVTDGICSELCVPITSGEKILGVLNVESKEADAFTEADERLVITIAGGIGTTMEKLQLFESEKRRSRIIEVLAEIANEIAITGEVSPLFEKIARRTSDLLHASHVAIYLLQDDGETIRPVFAHGSFSEEIVSHLLKMGEGITGNVMVTGRPEIIKDTRNDPRRIRVPGTPEEDGLLEAMMSCPLTVRGRTMGAINAWRLKSDGLFNESELNFLISIAQQTSIAIEAGRLFQETVRRGQESAAIAEVGRNISATLQLDTVLERIALYARDLLKGRVSAVYLSEPSGQELRAIAAFGDDADEIKNDPLQIGSGILGNIAQSKRGEIVNDTVSDPRAITIKGTDFDPDEHLMGVPVLSKDQLTGLLVVWRSGPEMKFKESDLEFLDGLAQQAAVAIENARLFRSEQKRREESENLRVAASAITSTLEPGQVLETILLALQQVVQYDSAAIFQLEGEAVRITAAKGFGDDTSAINQVFPANIDLFQRISQTGKPVILWNRREYQEFQEWIASNDMRGWMGVPLIARGRVVGFITLDSFTPGAYSDNDASLAQSFAHQAAVAIENARLFTETRQRMEELQVVSRVSFSLRVARDSTEMLPILLNEIKQSMDTDSTAIWLYDSNKDELVLKAANGLLANLPKPNFKPEEGIVGTVYSSGMIHLTSEFIKDPKATPENVKIFDSQWGGITVPIRTTAETIGVLSAAIHKVKTIESHQVRLMTTIAEIAGNAIYRSDLYEKSEEQVRRLVTLREMDTAISSSFDLHVTLEILNEHLLTKMGVGAVAILTLNPDTQMLDLYSGSGFRNQEALRSPVQAGDDLAGQILMTQKDIYIPNLEQTTRPAYATMVLREGFVSYYGVPMQSKGLTNGVLETYFRHPFTPNPDWIDFLHTLAGQATIAIENTRLFENLQRSNQELTLAYDTTLEGWGKALELRDKETEGHTRRVTELTLKLARKMNIPESQMTHIRRGVLVHDIGKMGVPDNILRKEGPLTDEEWVEMRKHPQYAFDLLYPIHYLRPALDIAYYHHEWWDGSGYPSGIKGNKIPLPARIFAVVDVWDALLSNRSYRTAWAKHKVIKYIRGLAGKQFDPHVVEVFLKMMQPGQGKSTGKTAAKKTVRKPGNNPK